MTSKSAALGVFAGIVLAGAVRGDDGGFVDLFNGRDLAGWVRVNCAPDTFKARDGLIVCTGVPRGFMRSQRQYENFVLELEWRHMKARGNAGVFIWSHPQAVPGGPFARSIEVQILDGRNTESYTSHGDIFSIQGASMVPDRPHPKGWQRCLPSERRCKPMGEWNHYRITCRDGAIKLSVNGKEVSGGSQCNPRKGYVCLESEGSETHFRNIRVKELPSSGTAPEYVAPQATGLRSLFTGVDLSGWRQDSGHEGHWRARDGRMLYDGKSAAKDKNLWTEKSFGDFVLSCDWRLTGKTVLRARPIILADGEYALDGAGKPKTVEVRDAGDSGIYLRGSSKSQVNIWCWPIGSGEVYGYRTDSAMAAEVRRGVTPLLAADNPVGKWNRFIITMKGEQLTVELNGKTVISKARLPGVAARGPIALQHHGDAIEFANLFLRELE